MDKNTAAWSTDLLRGVTALMTHIKYLELKIDNMKNDEFKILDNAITPWILAHIPHSFHDEYLEKVKHLRDS